MCTKVFSFHFHGLFLSLRAETRGEMGRKGRLKDRARSKGVCLFFFFFFFALWCCLVACFLLSRLCLDRTVARGVCKAERSENNGRGWASSFALSPLLSFCSRRVGRWSPQPRAISISSRSSLDPPLPPVARAWYLLSIGRGSSLLCHWCLGRSVMARCLSAQPA